MNESEILRGEDYVGFADIYRKRCDKESKPNNEIDKELYAELVKLDTRLGLQTITIWDHQVFTPAIVDFTFVHSFSLFVNFWKSEIRILYEPVKKLGREWKFERSSLFVLFIIITMCI